MDEIKKFNIEPSTNIMDTLGFSGYKIETAIADIIDNSIGANAKNIDIRFNFRDEDINNWSIDIIDDGYGMDSDTLAKAFKMADKSLKDERDLKDLGRYGVGLKTASISQADYVLVVSKMKNKDVTAKALDMKYLHNTKKWYGFDFDDNNEYCDLLNKDEGTMVRWKNLKFIENDMDYEKAKEIVLSKMRIVENHIAMIFNRFIKNEDVVIRIQNNIIKAWDPFYTQHLATTKSEEDEIKYRGSKIIIKAYTLPTKSNCTDEEYEYITKGDPLSYQGFYVFRNNRIIIAGGWLGSKKNKPNICYNNLRFSIDIDSSLDEALKVGFTKDSIDFPKAIMDKIDTIADKARKRVKETSKNKVLRKIKPQVKKDNEIWLTSIKDNKFACEINYKHPLIREYTKGIEEKNLKKLCKLLSVNVPKIYPDQNEIERFTDEEIIDMIRTFYVMEMNKNINEFKEDKKRFDEDVFKNIINLEPFDSYLDIVNSYFESEVFK